MAVMCEVQAGDTLVAPTGVLWEVAEVTRLDEIRPGLICLGFTETGTFYVAPEDVIVPLAVAHCIDLTNPAETITVNA